MDYSRNLSLLIKRFEKHCGKESIFTQQITRFSCALIMFQSTKIFCIRKKLISQNYEQLIAE